MKRLLTILCVVAFLAALPLSHVAWAAPKAKVEICHVNSANDVLDLGGGLVVAFGRLIEVAEPAVPAHVAHGDNDNSDPLYPVFLLDEASRDEFEAIFGISLPNANCLFQVAP